MTVQFQNLSEFNINAADNGFYIVDGVVINKKNYPDTGEVDVDVFVFPFQTFSRIPVRKVTAAYGQPGYDVNTSVGSSRVHTQSKVHFEAFTKAINVAYEIAVQLGLK